MDLEAFHFWEFSSKSFYLAFEGNHSQRASSYIAWSELAPPRGGAFCWLAVAAKVSTVDNLRRRGMASSNISDICVMYDKEEKSVNYLFFHCEVAIKVWSNFIGRCNIVWCCLKNITDAVASWHVGALLVASASYGG